MSDRLHKLKKRVRQEQVEKQEEEARKAKHSTGIIQKCWDKLDSQKCLEKRVKVDVGYKSCNQVESDHLQSESQTQHHSTTEGKNVRPRDRSWVQTNTTKSSGYTRNLPLQSRSEHESHEHKTGASGFIPNDSNRHLNSNQECINIRKGICQDPPQGCTSEFVSKSTNIRSPCDRGDYQQVGLCIRTGERKNNPKPTQVPKHLSIEGGSDSETQNSPGDHNPGKNGFEFPPGFTNGEHVSPTDTRGTRENEIHPFTN